MEQYAKTIYRRIFSKLKPPPEMKMSDWADQYRRLSQGASAEPGRWRTEKVPHQKEIMDTIADVKVKKVVVMSSAQIGKTEGAVLNTIGYYMHYDPAPVLIMQPTIQMAEAFSKDRLSKMLQDTPVLSGLVNDKGRNTGNTILQKIFPGGHITMVGANSPSSLASRPIQILLADEVDRYPATAGKEGDPLFLASERLTTFWNSKEVYVSTPTIKDASRIEIEYQHSSSKARKRNGTCRAQSAESCNPWNGPAWCLTGTIWIVSSMPVQNVGAYRRKRHGKSISRKDGTYTQTRKTR